MGWLLAREATWFVAQTIKGLLFVGTTAAPVYWLASRAVHDAAEAARLETGTELILLVEDEIPLLNLAARPLERLGYAVLAADAPGKPRQPAREYPGPIHLLLTDVVISGMSGRDLWREPLDLRPGLKCLFMSGHTADVIAHRGVLDEDVQFLQKPFSTQTLAARLRGVRA